MVDESAWQRAIHDAAGYSIITTDQNGVIRTVNLATERLFGYSSSELVGRPVALLHDREEVRSYADELSRTSGRKISSREAMVHRALSGGDDRRIWTYIRKDGSRFPAEVSISALRGNEGELLGFLGIGNDISARRATERSLADALVLQQAILDSANYSIIATDPDGLIVGFNRCAESMLGYRAEEVVGRVTPSLIHDPFEVQQRAIELSHELGTEISPGFEVFVARPRRGEIEERVWTYIRKDRHRIPVNLSVSPLCDAKGEITGFLGVARDVSSHLHDEARLEDANRSLEQRVSERTNELQAVNLQLRDEITVRRHAEARMRYLAHHDPLTTLPNRNLLIDRLADSIAEADALGRRVGVLLIDLDRFKNINDSLGHAVGDELLMQVGRRISTTLRGEGIVARLGGDEFCVMLPALPPDSLIDEVAAQLVDDLGPPFLVRDYELHVTPSIGVCFYPEDGNDPDSLLMNADSAMYLAKASGRSTYRRFHPDLRLRTTRNYELERELRHALERNELRLVYQPLVSGRSATLLGLEALVRWTNPGLGTVSPAHFIPVAEETGLIIPIGEWILHKVCRQLREWENAGLPVVPVSVNLSGVQFRRLALCDAIIDCLVEHDIPPSLIELEITESALMDDVQQTQEMLTRLASMGMRIAIDDFGTGYSSLAYLKRFPVTKLKIDQSFVRDLSIDPDDMAIVRAVIALAQAMELDVLAEGVETSEHARALLSAGCSNFQGYLFSKPVDPSEIPGFLKRQQLGIPPGL